jgi:uncharacterized protein (DUF983 family)
MARHRLTTSFFHRALRGAFGACPRCGGRGWFRHWFKRNERCPTCGYKAERGEGYMLGAMTMNVIITFFLLLMVILIGTIASYPHIAVVPMVIVGMTIAIGWPMLFYPASYTLWAAVDLLMRPLDEAEQADADAHADPAWKAAHGIGVDA